MKTMFLSAVIVFSVYASVSGAEYCYYYTYSYGTRYTYSVYCSNSCCGSYGYQYCCTTWYTTGAVAGIVIGSLAGLAVLIAIIVVCIKHKNRKSVMVTNGAIVSTPTVAVVSGTTQATGYPVQGAYPPNYYPQSYPSYGNPGLSQQHYNNPAEAQKTNAMPPPPAYT